MLEIAGLPPGQVACIVDDDPAKQGRDVMGIPIMTFAEACRAKPDVVVVSSLASEGSLVARLEQENRPSWEIAGVYRDLMGDPSRGVHHDSR